MAGAVVIALFCLASAILRWLFGIDHIIKHLCNIDRALNGEACSCCNIKHFIADMYRIDSGQYVCKKCRQEMHPESSLAHRLGAIVSGKK